MERILDTAPAHARAHGFTGPWRYIVNMFFFVALVTALVAWLFPAVEEAFNANVFINGLIVALLLLGVAYTFHQTLGIRPAVIWLRDFQRATRYDHLRPPPPLIAPMAMLLAETPGRLRISAQSARSILDAVAARMSEAGEITRYLARLLIFLGLLGTFWGLLLTVGSLVDTVNTLSGSATGGDEQSIAKLFGSITEPLKGMGTAFSSSMLGLAGSLVLGFLDLQATQASNRFFTETEDWLASVSRVGAVAPGGAEIGGSAAYVQALLEQMAESVDTLQSTLARAEEGRLRANDAMAALAHSLASLDDRLARQDEASVRYLQSIDIHMRQLAQSGGGDRDQAFRELRAELRALTKSMEGAADAIRRERHK